MKHTVVCLTCLLVWPLWSGAVSLSEPIVRSGLGQRLIVEIEVRDLERMAWPTLTAVIASPEIYQEQGVDYSNTVSDMSVLVLRHGDGRPYFRLIGQRPLNEAFVDIVLDVGWMPGHLVKKFTILPEPPVNDPRQQEGADGLTLSEREAKKERRFSQRKIDPADQMIGLADTIRRTESAEPEESELSPKMSSFPRAQGYAGERFRVHRKENLYRVALRWKAPHLGVHQKMLALYAANPHLFIQGNPNRLIRGRWMVTPKYSAGQWETEEQARLEWSELLRHPHQWLAANRLPEADESSTLSDGKAKEDESVESTVESIVPPIPPQQTLGELKEPSSPSRKSRGRLVVSDAGLKEKEIQRYRKLLDMENEIRKLIQQTEQRAPALALSKEMNTTVPALGLNKEAAESEHLSPLSSPSTAESAEKKKDTLPASSESTVQQAALVSTPVIQSTESTSATLGALSVSQLSSTAEAAARAGVKDSKGKSATAALKRRSPTPPLTIDESVFSPMPWWVGMMAGMAGLLATFSGIYGYRYRKRRREAVESLLKESAELVNADSIFTDTGQSLADMKASAAHLAGAGSLNRENLLNVDTDMQVDPLVEADVYISYERYDAAEGLLKSALEQHPHSREILWRLFDVYLKSGRRIEARHLAQQLNGMYGEKDPKQRVLCDILGIPFGSLFAKEGSAPMTAEGTDNTSLASYASNVEEHVLSETDYTAEDRPALEHIGDTKEDVIMPHSEVSSASEEEVKDEVVLSPIRSSAVLIDIQIPPLDFTGLNTEIGGNRLKAENLEDGTIDSQLKLAQVWVAQGKLSSARALLEAIIETAKHPQKERALALLDSLSGTSESDK
jgi:pilus assembly protein FimV